MPPPGLRRIMSLRICLRWPEGQGGAPAPAALHPLALAMLQYTPQVALFRQNAVILEVAASLTLFGGVRRLCRQIRRTASSLAPQAVLGMAPSATGAWLLAASPCASHRRVLRNTTLAHHLDNLSIDSLPETQPHRQWLDNIGCRHLANLRKLPRQGLQQRSSPALLRALDAAYGQANEPLAWFVPPAAFRLMLEPDTHLEHSDTLLKGAQPLLQALCGWLHQRQEAVHDFLLVLHHEKGRHALAPTRLALRFSAATWRIEDFTLLLKERLQHCSLQRPVIRLELIANAPQPRLAATDTLFPDPSRHAQEENRLRDLLAARLGPESIRRPAPQPQHLPELANIWRTDAAVPPGGPPPEWVGWKSRPFWLLRQPLLLSTRQERPLYQGRVLRLVQGPERIETGWHAGVHQRRDYFVAEDSDGARYWLYRERETGDGWFLHGLFA